MDSKAYSQLTDYIAKGEVPEELTKNMKDVLRRKAKSYTVTNGLLFYRDVKKGDLQVRNCIILAMYAIIFIISYEICTM